MNKYFDIFEMLLLDYFYASMLYMCIIKSSLIKCLNQYSFIFLIRKIFPQFVKKSLQLC